MFNGILYKQKDDTAMGWPLGTTVENVFFYHFMKWHGLNSTLVNLKQFFTKDMWMFYLNLTNTSQYFMLILIHVILICLFNLNKKKDGQLSFLKVKVSWREKVVTTVVTTLSVAYIHFNWLSLPKECKFGVTYILPYHCFNFFFNVSLP